MSSHDLETSHEAGFVRGRRLLLIGFVFALLLAPAASSVADSPTDWGYTGGSDPIRAPDSRDHWHCKTHYPIEHQLLNSAMTQLDAQTVLSRNDSSSCGSSTDVVWVKTALCGIRNCGAYGKTICVSHAYWGVCDQFWVLIDQPLHYVQALTRPDAASNPGHWYSVNIQLTMRHELGHSAGLHHYTGPLHPYYGTMNSATVPNSVPGYLYYLLWGPIHMWLINSHM